MSSSRKGKRRLVVDGVAYHWVARGTDYGGVTVGVATDEAFVPGQRGQWLHFKVPYDVVTGTGGGCSASQRAAVTPALVRRAIELARGLEPPFTGRAGLPDQSLPSELVATLLPQVPLERVRLDLGLASRLLGEIIAASGEAEQDETTRSRQGAAFCSLCLSLRLELERPGAGPEPSAEVDAWFRAAAPSLERVVPHVEAARRALEQTIERPWPAWQHEWHHCCDRCSALAAFVEFGRRAGLAGLDALAARVGRLALDARLRSPREHEGKGALGRSPYDAPASHWWWALRAPAAGG